MHSLSTPHHVYPAKRARLLDAKAKERCDKAVPHPRNMAALTHAYQLYRQWEVEVSFLLEQR